ncbi:MAG: hypothetical protein WAW86_05495 [Gammaproteobacteria bacterium]
MQSHIDPTDTLVSLEDMYIDAALPTAPAAFKTILDETVLKAIGASYQTPMGFLPALLDMVYQDEHFSWVKVSTLSGAALVGICSAIFYVRPAHDAASIIGNLIKTQTGYDPTTYLAIPIQTASVGENGAVSTYCALEMIKTYFPKISDAERFLIYHEATNAEKFSGYGRKMLDLLAACSANVATFAITLQSGSWLTAAVTSVANIALSRQGMSNISIKANKQHPAQRTEVAYLTEQLNTFLKLPRDEQITIFKTLAAFKNNALHDANFHQQCFTHLLNLAKQTSSDDIEVQAYPPSTFQEKIIPPIVGALGFECGSPFTIVAAVSINNLVPGHTSAKSMMATLPIVLLNLLPMFGYGYLGAYKAGEAITSDDVPLAKIFNPALHTSLKWLINFISIFSGGATFGTAHAVGNNFSDFAKIAVPFKEILSLTYATTASMGGAFLNGYYTLCLLDEVLTYFAERCGNEEVKGLFALVLETRKLTNVLNTMTEANYLELLKWKMSDPTLSDLLHSIFDNRLSVGEYKKLQRDVNTDLTTFVKAREQLPNYRLIPSFFEKEAAERERRNPSLHRRHGGGLFGGREVDRPSGDIEMNTLNLSS